MTQLVQLLHDEPLQHIAAQTVGSVIPMTQPWKQAMSALQLKSPRQVIVSMQQSLTMHWLQGVPPGSSGQLPASTGRPQWPPEQTSPMQHCAVSRQLEPVGKQLPSPHWPLVHAWLQHCPGEEQGMPSSLHTIGSVQTLAWHRPLQHSKLSKQNWPLGTQPWKVQIPFTGSQTLLQQSLLSKHGKPLG